MKVSDNGVGWRSGLIEVSTNRYLCAKHKVLLSRAVGRRKAYWCAVFKDRGRAYTTGANQAAAEYPRRSKYRKPRRTLPIRLLCTLYSEKRRISPFHSLEYRCIWQRPIPFNALSTAISMPHHYTPSDSLRSGSFARSTHRRRNFLPHEGIKFPLKDPSFLP